MKKFKTRNIVISVIISFILLVILFIIYYSTFLSREVKKAKDENLIKYDTTNTKENLNIVFMGDSITNGYSSDGVLVAARAGYRDEIQKALPTANLINFAVGGYKIPNIITQLEEDVTLYSTNEVILYKNIGAKDYKELTNIYEIEGDNDVHIIESLQNADILVITLGANDTIEKILTFDEEGNMNVQAKGIFKNMRSIKKQKKEIYKNIKEINPNIQIYDVGMYFSYPHQTSGDKFMKYMYPILALVESNIFIEDKKNEIHKVTIRDNMQVDIRNNVDNPDDIHPSEQGYDVIANEILKEIQKYN